jgi:predicted ATPase/class 3 adenylate cyclase
MPELPTGTVTFLLTDIEGSTRLWEQDPVAMRAATARHDALVEEIVGGNGGVLVRPRGEGDSRFAVFARATDAVTAAVFLQRALVAEPWPTPQPLRVRLALHTGEADLRDGDYYGAAINRCARLRAIGHGGQVLLSQPTYELVRDALPPGVTVQDLGEQRLADLIRSEQVYQLRGANLPTEFPPLRSLDAYPHNLPVQLTSFIGREQELAELGRALPTTRLLTLTGTGGCGKTRLALQLAADQVERFPEGAWVVELAPLTDHGLVTQAVAAAIGVREEPGQPLLATLVAALRSRRLLLVLDNCEHLLDACARLTDALLRGCPHLHVLATSREALGIGGEVARRVRSLAVPPPDQLPPLAQLTQYEAVRLFLERANAVQPAFAVTNQNAPTVAQICQRLDGIPLALELAAARVRVLAVERIAARLDDQFRLLTGGSRTALPRQQTLRAAIDWSYNLLTEPERRLLRCLSVFAGGCTLEAAEAIGEDANGAGDATVRDRPFPSTDALDLLTALVDKSLVQVETREGEERYRLLETIRQYGRDRLVDAGEAESVRNQHFDWFLALAERVEPELIGPRQVVWLDRLEVEQDNFRAALAWGLDSRPAIRGLRLAGALWRWWHVRDRENEGLDWLRRVLAAPGAEAPTATRAKALQGVWELIVLGEGGTRTEQVRAAEDSLAIFQQLGDRSGAAWSLSMVGRSAYGQGEYARAESLLDQALTLARQEGARWVMAQTLEGLGALASGHDDLLLARQRHEASLALFRDLGDRRAIAAACVWDGIAAGLLGDMATARARLTEALGISRELRSEVRISHTLLQLAELALSEGNYGQSQAYLEESVAIARDIGSRWVNGAGLICSGWLARAEGDNPRAIALMRAALRLLQAANVERGIARCLRNLGILAVEAGRVRRGACLLGAADAKRDRDWLSLRLFDGPRAYEASKSAARRILGDDAFELAWAEGQAMTLEQAVAYALGEDAH